MVIINDEKFESGTLSSIDNNVRRGSLTLSVHDVQRLRSIAPNGSLLELPPFQMSYGDTFNESMVEFTQDGGNIMKILW